MNRRHVVGNIARSPHGHRIEAARWSCEQRKILNGNLGKKKFTMIVGSEDNRMAPAQLKQGCHTVPVQCP